MASCAPSNDSNGSYVVNVREWNRNTFDFIDDNCTIDISYPLILGSERPPAKIQGQIFTTAKSYIEEQLVVRDSISSAIEELDLDGDNLYVLEIYTSQSSSAVIKTSGGSQYRFTLNDTDYAIERETQQEVNELLFRELSSTEQTCIARFISVPTQLKIFNRYDPVAGFQTYQISMLN